MVKVVGINADDMGFNQSVQLLLASSHDSAGEWASKWPMHKIVLT